MTLLVKALIYSKANPATMTKDEWFDVCRELHPETLDALIERAREYRKEHAFSEEEQDRQVRSFAYGNTRLENGNITMADIDKAMESLRSEYSRK